MYFSYFLFYFLVLIDLFNRRTVAQLQLHQRDRFIFAASVIFFNYSSIHLLFFLFIWDISSFAFTFCAIQVESALSTLGGPHLNSIYGVRELQSVLHSRVSFLQELDVIFNERGVIRLLSALFGCIESSTSTCLTPVAATDSICLSQDLPGELITRIQEIRTVTQLQQLVKENPTLRIEVEVGDCSPCAIARTTIDKQFMQPTDFLWFYLNGFGRQFGVSGRRSVQNLLRWKHGTNQHCPCK